jgi:amidohydrolase
MDLNTKTRERLAVVRERALDVSHRIHANPELGFAEYDASRLVASSLGDIGFDVALGVAELPTAIAASFGEGDLVIGLFAEYDALPEMGHACGHNIIAGAAICAAELLAPIVDQLGITIKVFGTPAEECGGGKVVMLERGVFDGVHAAMMVHPAPVDLAVLPAIAVDHLAIRYTGRTAHASGAAHRGHNAADAFTVAQVGIGLLRQHLARGTEVHGIVTNGGEAPNIVPGHTEGRYYVRACTTDDLGIARARIERCFEAGAWATGCEVSLELASPTYRELSPDFAIQGLYQANAERLDRRFVVLDHNAGGGSTDMGNVSFVIPSIHPTIGVASAGASNHQAEFAECCVLPTGDQALLDGALAMAWTVIDIATSPAQRSRLLELEAAAKRSDLG